MEGEIEGTLSFIFGEIITLTLRMFVAVCTCFLASSMIHTVLTRDMDDKGRRLATQALCFLLLHVIYCGWQQLDNGMFIAILYSGDFFKVAASAAGAFLSNVALSLVAGLVLFLVGGLVGNDV